ALEQTRLERSASRLHRRLPTGKTANLRAGGHQLTIINGTPPQRPASLARLVLLLKASDLHRLPIRLQAPGGTLINILTRNLRIRQIPQLTDIHYLIINHDRLGSRRIAILNAV